MTAAVTISDALTAAEARDALAMWLGAVERHDETGDTAQLHRDLHAAARYTEALAFGVPDDSDWPDADAALVARNTANSRRRDNVIRIDGRTTGEWAAITGLCPTTIRKRYRRGVRPPALFRRGRVSA